MNLCLDIQRASSAAGIPGDDLFERWVRAALAGRREDAELSLRLVDEAEMTELNGTWRKRHYATNVLSFPADLPPELQLPHLGDIAICAPVVLREAAEQGKPVEAHWAHLVVHGILHLLGHDHIEDNEAEAMENLERELLAALAYPDPYNDSEESTRSHG